MEINVRHKLRSLLRRQQPYFCLSYDFNSREICVHPTHADYFAEVVGHRDNGHVKRAEVYCREIIEAQGQEYLIYMVSYGDFRRGKIVMGQNPLAKGLGICLFDYVYVFVEEKSFARKKMLLRMSQLQEQGQYFQLGLMEDVYHDIFGEDMSTDFCTSQRRPLCSNPFDSQI